MFLYLGLLFCIIVGFTILIRYWRRSERRNHYYMCLDGHLVKSRGEWMIDACLQFLGVPHEYETPLRVRGQTLHPDFSLGHGIYIEYWGLQTKGYLRYKKRKQRLYRKTKFYIIDIGNSDLKNLLQFFTLKLEKYRDLFPQFQNVLELLNYNY